MLVDEKINLIGKILAYSNDSDPDSLTNGTSGDSHWNTIEISYSNSTDSVLRLEAIEAASGRCDDHNDRSHNFYWELISTTIIKNSTEEEIISEQSVGTSGANNKQYDFRTYDTIWGKRFIELRPGEKLTLQTKMIWYNDDDAGIGSEDWIRYFIRNKIIVVGVIDA